MSQSLVVGVVSMVLVAGAAGCAQPAATVAASYGDCILQHVESGMDANVVGLIRTACRDNFPSDAAPADTDAVDLDGAAVSRVAFRRSGGSASGIFGVLYNGNTDVTLTEVDIAITTVFEGAEESHTYRAREVVPPLGTATVNLSILPGDQRAPESAAITAARGRRAQ